MEFRLKSSKQMNNNHKVINIPKQLRQSLNIKVGDFVTLRTKDNDILTLQVQMALKEDIVQDINAAYVIPEILKNILVEENTKLKVVNDVTLGCDPEFILLDRGTGDIVKTNRFFTKYGPIGYDHEGSVAEFRPSCDQSEDNVCKHLYNLIKRARQQIDRRNKTHQNIMFYGISHHKGITNGFHLHYGIPQAMMNHNNELVEATIRLIIKAFDYYVGIPAIIPEGKYDTFRRTFNQIPYGKPGGYRHKDTLEYRVPGGNLLRHPIFTKGILGIGALVIEDILSRIKTCTNEFKNLKSMLSFENLRELYPNIVDMPIIFRIICSHSTYEAEKYVYRIYEDLKQMVGFTKRKDAIDSFFNNLEKINKIGHDIEHNWHAYYKET